MCYLHFSAFSLCEFSYIQLPFQAFRDKQLTYAEVASAISITVQSQKENNYQGTPSSSRVAKQVN